MAAPRAPSPKQPTPEHGALATDLERAVSGQPWHGPSLAMLLEGVTARDAAAHPIAGAHSIWELALHLTAWTDEVARRLGGAAPSEPEAATGHLCLSRIRIRSGGARGPSW
jgi:hypothetical protein